MTRAVDATSIARVLVESGAVSFRAAPPYRFTSGIESPIYVDNRRLLGLPGARAIVVKGLVDTLRAVCSAPDAIAGTATAGIPWAAWIAQELRLPLLYVRSQAKEWGKGRTVEGLFEPGMGVVLVEDLVSTGGSVGQACNNLQAEGISAGECIAIVTYGMPAADVMANRLHIRLTALVEIDETLSVAQTMGAISQEDALQVRTWLDSHRAAATVDPTYARPTT